MKDVVLFFFTAMYDFDDIACIAIMFVTGFFVCTNIALSNQWLRVTIFLPRFALEFSVSRK